TVRVARCAYLRFGGRVATAGRAALVVPSPELAGHWREDVVGDRVVLPCEPEQCRDRFAGAIGRRGGLGEVGKLRIGVVDATTVSGDRGRLRMAADPL